MEIYLSEIAEVKLLKLTDYLLEEWGKKSQDKFIEKLLSKLNQISLYPESCVKSSDFEGLYRCIVSKHTTLYYRVLEHEKQIEIITIFDSRQNPELLKEELRGKPDSF